MDDGDVTWVGQVRRALDEGESYTVEFTSERSTKLNDRDLVEAVVCLANGAGGLLLLGVEDDGTPTGSRPRHEAGRTDPLRVQAYIANTTQPPVSATVQLVDVDGVEILAVEVPDSPRVVGTSRGTYVRRAVGSDGRPMCIPFHAHEMLAHDIDRGPGRPRGDPGRRCPPRRPRPRGVRPGPQAGERGGSARRPDPRGAVGP